MIYVGIDPGVRHVGLCVLEPSKYADSVFHEVKTEPGVDLLSASEHIRSEVTRFMRNEVLGEPVIYAMERQLPAGRSSAQLFFIQMVLLGVIQDRHYPRIPTTVMPLPIQLRSYVQKRYGVAPKATDKQLVACFKDLIGFNPTTRIPVHCVDAFFLAIMAQDVATGSWTYPLPKKELALTPWRHLNGDVAPQPAN